MKPEKNVGVKIRELVAQELGLDFDDEENVIVWAAGHISDNPETSEVALHCGLYNLSLFDLALAAVTVAGDLSVTENDVEHTPTAQDMRRVFMDAIDMYERRVQRNNIH